MIFHRFSLNKASANIAIQISSLARCKKLLTWPKRKWTWQHTNCFNKNIINNTWHTQNHHRDKIDRISYSTIAFDSFYLRFFEKFLLLKFGDFFISWSNPSVLTHDGIYWIIFFLFGMKLSEITSFHAKRKEQQYFNFSFISMKKLPKYLQSNGKHCRPHRRTTMNFGTVQ